jgi:hypothetical protein
MESYRPLTFVYIPDDILFFTIEVDVPIVEHTHLGDLILGNSRQKLVYGRTTPESVLDLYEFQLIGVE